MILFRDNSCLIHVIRVNRIFFVQIPVICGYNIFRVDSHYPWLYKFFVTIHV